MGKYTTHRRIGDAIGCDSELEPVRLRCACGHHQTESLASDEPLRAQAAGVTCSRCGQLGAMALAPRVAA